MQIKILRTNTQVKYIREGDRDGRVWVRSFDQAVCVYVCITLCTLTFSFSLTPLFYQGSTLSLLIVLPFPIPHLLLTWFTFIALQWYHCLFDLIFKNFFSSDRDGWNRDARRVGRRQNSHNHFRRRSQILWQRHWCSAAAQNIHGLFAK